VARGAEHDRLGRRRLEDLAAAASLPLLLLLWHLAAVLAQSPVFPTPLAVAGRMWDLAANRFLLPDLAVTLGRAFAAFAAAMLIGIVLALLLGRVRILDRLTSSWIIVGLNVPAIVVAILAYVWLGLTDLALVIAVVINKVPLVTTIVRQGVHSLSPDYAELARAFRMPVLRRLRLVTAPQLLPYVLAAARSGLSLIWKIVLVFEILGSDGGVGYRIGIFFQFFDVEAILAYTVAFIAVVLALDYLVLRPGEHRLARWQAQRR
jgi:NitT/TauT family transport system permease protein